MGVVNLLGILFEKRSGDFLRLHRDMAERIAKAAHGVGVRRLVHMSAIGADPKGRALYARRKGEGEARVRAAFPAATIIRPSVVFGPGDGFFARFARMSMVSPFLPLIEAAGRGSSRSTWPTSRKPWPLPRDRPGEGQDLRVGGPRVATFAELQGYTLKTVNRRRLICRCPAPSPASKRASSSSSPRRP
jgi:NADH dehydrogenase